AAGGAAAGAAQTLRCVNHRSMGLGPEGQGRLRAREPRARGQASPSSWDAFGGRAAYEALRTKYRATRLPSVYDKVKVRDDDEAASNAGWKPFLKSLWPVGGLYGIWKGIQSKDYMLHRHSTWRWRPGSGKEKTA
ncbi:hypothetical protein EKO27_g12056, partial [Xylaria grammica]